MITRQLHFIHYFITRKTNPFKDALISESNLIISILRFFNSMMIKLI